MRTRILDAPPPSTENVSRTAARGGRRPLPVPAPRAASGLFPARGILLLLRPRHWVKNGFVLTPLLLTPTAVTWSALWMGLRGVLAFCAIASAVYVLNDVMDRDADRMHPLKRRRPVAAGTVAVPVALAAMGALAGLGAAVAAFLPYRFQILIAAYLLLNVAYSTGL
ncbi:MAG TPA: UbiA family prenyltransferase, partial [Longimicrobiales bacterium]|nr:UbiA family prenyltransferase [Longimicrobiales bacterium]